jgi:DNA-binding transcriptional regulator YiaG
MANDADETQFPVMPADEFKSARQELGLLQRELAARLEVTIDAIKQYESGRRKIKGPARALILKMLAENRKKP